MLEPSPRTVAVRNRRAGRLLPGARVGTLGTLAALAILLGAAPGLPAAAQSGCSGGTPAYGVTSALWTDLRPTDTGRLPLLRDSTAYHGQTVPGADFPLFSSIDVEGGYAFLSYSSGLQIWDVRPPNDASPSRIALLDGWQGRFLVWPAHDENREVIFDVDVPDGGDGALAAAGLAPVGLSVFDVRNVQSPSQVYQDLGRTALEVYAAHLGGRSWAFAAAEGSAGNGIQLYDLTAALALPAPCWEDSTLVGQCAGVYRGRIGALQSVSHVDGAEAPDGRHYLAASSGSPALGPRGVEIWDVTDPLHPAAVKPGGGRYLADSGYGGVALWSHAGRFYLAAVRLAATSQVVGEVYDLTACLSSACSDLAPRRVASLPMAVSAERSLVTVSSDGSRPYLYFGNENLCSFAQREWLFDVSDPAAPRELAAGATLTLPGTDGVPRPTTYWSWYYGYSHFMPRVARFSGQYLYRAGWTVFDVHRLQTTTPPPPPPPAADSIFSDGFESGGLEAWTASRL